jgi:hypothetical protein
MHHDQDCCESVSIESIKGNLGDLVGSPLTVAREDYFDNELPSDMEPPEYRDDLTKVTDYTFATANGEVRIRWFGQSNGYYSVAVQISKI